MNSYLLGKIKNDDTIAFQEVFIEYYPALIFFANKLLNDSGQAEDIVQEVFVNIWEDRRSLGSIRSISSYLYSSVRNKAYNYIRDNKRFVDAEREFDFFSNRNIEDILIEEESIRLILNGLEILPPRCEKIMRLSIKGMKSRDIAEELNIAIETVKKQKQIAKRILKDRISKLLTILCMLN